MSKREDIMAAFAAALAQITVANGYNMNVLTVQRWIQAPTIGEADFALFPLVIVEEGTEDITYEAGRQTKNVLAFLVKAYIMGAVVPDPTTFNNFVEDIRKCVEANNTVGGNATDSVVVRVTPAVAEALPYAMATLDVLSSYYVPANDI